MEVDKILELFRKYIDQHKQPAYTSIQMFRDGSGCLLQFNNKEINGTDFNNIKELHKLLTTPSELEKSQETYVKALGKHYSPGSKIILQVINEDLVEVTVRPA
jgi:hypothetical protein